jgi:NADH/NAD ratio-sensing transcriptional regulator Rex
MDSMEILKKISQARQDNLDYEGKVEDTVFVGSGVLAESYLQRPGFAGPAVHILAAFFDKPATCPCFEVFEMEKLQNLVPRLGVHTAILCVPHRQAANLAQILERSGVTRILNWSGADLTPTGHTAILNEEPPATTAE